MSKNVTKKRMNEIADYMAKYTPINTPYHYLVREIVELAYPAVVFREHRDYTIERYFRKAK